MLSEEEQYRTAQRFDDLMTQIRKLNEHDAALVRLIERTINKQQVSWYEVRHLTTDDPAVREVRELNRARTVDIEDAKTARQRITGKIGQKQLEIAKLQRLLRAG